MKLLLLLIFIPFVSFSQILVMAGLERHFKFEKSERIKPLHISDMWGPTLQFIRMKEGGRFSCNLMTGFQWAGSGAYSNVHCIPALAGADLRVWKGVGISTALGIRAIYADGTKTYYPFDFKAGLSYVTTGFINGLQIKYGYERIGNSNMMYIQINLIPLFRTKK